MARPIEETPVLKGKDARAFERNLEQAKDKRVSESELTRILKNHKAMIELYVDTKK
jgi:hypothetical protein